ncbi:hypothetical protein B566_EDAN009111 [Ephemera danica]|nr:hypothetical protein B566_EDAN009111 [Ephemera danica]
MVSTMSLVQRSFRVQSVLKSYMSTASTTHNIIPVAEVTRYGVDCMRAVNVPLEHASMLAEVLVAADYRGHYSHGLNRLEMYVRDVKTGICDGSVQPAILRRTAATALVDGRNGLGPVVGNFCMKLAIKKARETGVGWIAAKGSVVYQHVTTDEPYTLQKGTLMPLGGTELTSGYKGYGLALLVELLCGIMADATYGPNVRRWMTTDREANLGQCFIAVDPGAFAPGFSDRLQDLLDYLRKMEPSDPSSPVLVAGDPERKQMAFNDKQGGIQYHENQIIASKALAELLKVTPMKPAYL